MTETLSCFARQAVRFNYYGVFTWPKKEERGAKERMRKG